MVLSGLYENGLYEQWACLVSWSDRVVSNAMHLGIFYNLGNSGTLGKLAF